MTQNRLKNIPLKLFQEYLLSKGLKVIRTNGGHEIWGGKPLSRPIVLQTHISPVPEFIVKNCLRTLNSDAEDFKNFCES
jgi:hypothetical protein